MPTKEIRIKVSKTKIVGSILGSLLFVLLGCWFIYLPEIFAQTTFKRSIVLVVGYVSMLFFGLCFILWVKKYFNRSVGLIINSDGIINNTTSLSVGLIRWTEIVGNKTIKIQSTKILLIFVRNPEEYLKKVVNAVDRRIMNANYKMYGTPISIISNSLSISFSELERIIEKAIEENINLDA